MLEEGGNAFDAVIAALWTACAAEPVLASPGGGGFLLAHPAEGSTSLYDFFVHTPRKRQKQEEFYPITVDFGVAQQAFHVGRGAVAVPGFVRGLFDVHRDPGIWLALSGGVILAIGTLWALFGYLGLIGWTEGKGISHPSPPPSLPERPW